MSIKILTIIPARGGSKGIPRKNLRSLNGKPLIYYSIKTALSLNAFDSDCYVTSDDDEILVIATKLGAKTIKRDKAISGDKITLDPVIYNAYKQIRQIEKKDYDLVITLQPTSPLLLKDSIYRAIERLQKSKLDTIISGINDTHLTWLKREDSFVPNYSKRLNRQELPQIYKETGGFVITKSNCVLENSRFGKKIEIFPLSKRESIDIDDFDDWNLCEFYLKRKTVLFVVTGNSVVGMGHVYNTLSIANDILNHHIVFLVDKNSQLAYKKISESNYEVFIQKEESIIEDIYKINPEIVVNDILDTDENYISCLKKKGYSVINFEDLGPGSEHADLVINAMYPEKKLMVNHYYGSRYFILRDEFLYTREKTIGKVVKNVLISFGGVDPNDFTRRVLNTIFPLCKKHNIKITVITGMGYGFKEHLKNEYPEIKIKNNVSNISDEILKADLVFTSAGRTTFEVASIGTPCIVLCQNKRETTHFFASEENGFYNIGLGENVSDDMILTAFSDCLENKLRALMNERMLKNKLKSGKSTVLELINALI